MVGRVGRVDRVDECLVGPPARVGLRLQQVVEPFVAQPLDLVRWEGRPEQDLGQELESGAQPRRRHVDADAGGVPAGIGVEGCAQPLARLDQGDGIVSLGPLGQGPGGQDGGPTFLRRLVDRSGRDHDRRADQRPARQVGDQDGQSVVEPGLGQARELVRARHAWCRALGDDVPVEVQAVRSGHAATSSSWSVSASAVSSASVSTTLESAGAISGR
jgi:hypothetical protein